MKPRAAKSSLPDVVVLIYLGVLATASLSLAGSLVMVGERPESPLAVGGLMLAGAMAERGRVSLAANLYGSVSLLPTVFAAVVFGPLGAMAVAAGSYIGEFPPLVPSDKRTAAPYTRWGVYTCIRALYGGAAGLAAETVSGRLGVGIGAIVVATTVAVLVAEPLDIAFAALTWRLRGGRAAEIVRAAAPIMAAAIPLYAPVVALLAIAYVQLSPWTLPLFFVPALAAQHLYALYQDQRVLAEDLANANSRLEAASVSFAGALVATLDARDRYTAGHSAAVAIYAQDVARRLGLTDREQRLAHLAGLVHDIGKIGLPAGLLEKPGALTLEERRHMERHSVIGERILAKVETYSEVAAIVRHHHERVDGQGYPDGLAEDEIPLLARIIAVADAYNAMTSDRPYRDAMPSRVARLRLAQAVGSQFDTAVVAAFEAILATATEDYRLGRRSDFKFELQNTDSEDTRAQSSLFPMISELAQSSS